MNLKKALAVLGASLITFSCASSAAMCTSASLISDLVNKLNNDVFDYGTIVETTDGYTYAKIIMESPDSTLEFKNIAESDIKSNSFANYAGTIEIGSEIYHVCRQKPMYYPEQIKNLETDYNDYIFYHVYREGTDPNEGSFMPLYELIEAAQNFGLKTGKLTNVTFDQNEYKCSCDVSALKLSDTAAPAKIYSDISMRKSSYIIIGKYDFYSPDYYLISGNEMLARPDGCFTINANKNILFNTANYVDSYVELNLGRISVYELSEKNDISIDHHINDSMDGKYGMVYTLYLSSADTNTHTEFRIAEKISGMDIDEFFKSYEASYGVGNSLQFKSSELITSYTQNGHEYDLYKGKYHFYGDVSSYDDICYLAVRKDTDDADSYESCIDVYEHMNHIPEFSAVNKISLIELAFHNCGALGSVDVTKNDISFFENSIPDIIAGDFNNDKQVDSMDLVSARYAIISQLNDENTAADAHMDLNKNGKFDVADLVLLQSFVLGKIKTLP
ncbi:dockerin type I repeat-containing protein [Ruminococcus flavefaciens]|uniref:dockerin type I repeat-containing protein n=1 Tax=Ruminococcus flavefaciens TaxID=1265 RepID=UPI00048A7512|nr:dockerin type I repeat-containing protein [Ruminococcus flavefaciens]